jgi:uncharacterized protein (TIGR00369 family)
VQRETSYQDWSLSINFRFSMQEQITELPATAENISLGGFNKYAGPVYRLSADPSGMAAHYAFIAEQKHMNSAGSVHGGMLMTFADIAMSRTARLGTNVVACNTVSLNADFVGPGRLGDLIEARVRVTRRTRTLVFQSAEIIAGERLLLSASGLWKIGPK